MGDGLQHTMRWAVHLGVWGLAMPAGFCAACTVQWRYPIAAPLIIHSDQFVSRPDLMTEKVTMHE